MLQAVINFWNTNNKSPFKGNLRKYRIRNY